MGAGKGFSLAAPKSVFFGEGETDRIADILDSRPRDSRKGVVLILTDQGVAGSGVPRRIASHIESRGFQTTLVDTVPREPYSEDVEALVSSLHGGDIWCIVGIGGGSVLDTAKLLSVLLRWSGTVASLIETGAPGPGIPCIMVPTTAGTGSEATPNAIVALREKQLKVGVVSPFFMPDYVILDPVVTRSLPASLTASTGMDAYCHVLECYTSRKANPFSDLIALEGIRLIDGALRNACRNGNDMQARTDMLLGSFYGGLAIASSGTTAVHALSYPLGGRYRVPHGVSNAILLVPVMDFNKDAIMEKLGTVAQAVGSEPGSGVAETVNAYIAHVRELIREIGIPSTMKDFDVTPDAIPELAEAAFQVKRLLNNNPKEMSKADIEAVYHSIR